MNAFVLRINPSQNNKIDSNLIENRISIGWSHANAVLNDKLDWPQFREIVHQEYYSEKENYRASGNAAGSLWRFVREMNPGDIVLIPSTNSDFYIAKIKGGVEYKENKVEDDTAFSRDVEYLNEKLPIKREKARVGIISRLKVYQTCVECTDLLADIQLILQELADGKSIPFDEELRRKLTKTILQEIRTGKIDNFRFEKLLRNLFLKLGAKTCDIIPRKYDKGSDLIAEFKVGDLLPITVSIQAKHWNDIHPVGIEEIQQLENGVVSDKTNYGIFITSGIYSEECLKYVISKNEEQPALYLIDGEELANMLFNNTIFELN